MHVYHAAPQEEPQQERFAHPFHTDNGVLLMVTPFREHPIQVTHTPEKNIKTRFIIPNLVFIFQKIKTDH